jgi:putative ABC transport system substrate-binding protein
LPNQVTFTSHIASNDIAACSGIVNQFIAEEVDLILANATPALQIASAATGEIPILGTSVTAFGAALGIDDFDGVVGGNVSGTSDLAPLDAQAKMIQEWFPDAETIGMLYCSAEVNSDYQITEVSKLLEEMGYTCEDFAFTESNDLPLVLEAAIANCDVLFVPTDNTVASNSTIIDNYCRPAGIPILGGDQGICNGCTAATLCVSYYDLGYQTGLMAAKVLTGEADISTMPIEYGSTTSVYNEAICADLGLTPPSAEYTPVSVC